MSQPDQVEIGQDDIESLAGKLDTLIAGLNEREQAILSHILRTAAESASEVSMYADTGFNAGVAFNLAVAVGLGDVSAAKTQHRDMSFTKLLDKASPKLYE
jgi:Type VI secretion system effector, Hcp